MPSYGPIFGSGHDLCSNSNNWTSYPHTFPKLDIPSSFNTVDCEVFQIKHNSLS